MELNEKDIINFFTKMSNDTGYPLDLFIVSTEPKLEITKLGGLLFVLIGVQCIERFFDVVKKED